MVPSVGECLIGADTPLLVGSGVSLLNLLLDYLLQLELVVRSIQ